MTSFVVTVQDDRVQEVMRLAAKLGVPLVGDMIDLSLSLLLWANGEREAGRIVGSTDPADNTYRELKLPDPSTGAGLHFTWSSGPKPEHSLMPEQQKKFDNW